MLYSISRLDDSKSNPRIIEKYTFRHFEGYNPSSEGYKPLGMVRVEEENTVKYVFFNFKFGAIHKIQRITIDLSNSDNIYFAESMTLRNIQDTSSLALEVLM